MTAENTADELGAHKFTVNNNGEIHLFTDSESIKIGNIQSLHELEIYENGTHTNDNGFVVDLKQLIHNLVVTDAMAGNLKRYPDRKSDKDDTLTMRMRLFHFLVFSLAQSADSTDKDWVLH